MNNHGRNLHARIGYLQDWLRLFTFRFENPHSWMKYRQIEALRKRTGSNYLIETGTYLGVTTARVAKHFTKVSTIELDPTLCEKARNYLKPYPHVNVIEGDGSIELPKCLELSSIDKKIIVFLDGHFSGGETICGDHAEPACLEVEAMKPFVEKIHGCIIDDFRLFGVQEGYPPKSQLLSTVERVFGENEFKVYVQFDQLLIRRIKTSRN